MPTEPGQHVFRSRRHADGSEARHHRARSNMRCASSIGAVPSEDELTWCIGPPLRASFATLLGDESLADRGRRALSRAVCRHRPVRERVYPDIEHVLAALADRAAACSSRPASPRSIAKRIVEHFGLARLFRDTCSARSWTARASTRTSFWPMPSTIARTDPAQVDHDRRSQPRCRGCEAATGWMRSASPMAMAAPRN